MTATLVRQFKAIRMYSETRMRDNRFWTLFFNAFHLRCPICKEGKIFPTWCQFTPQCPSCGTTIEQGQGYFLGSIYFNYGATCVIATISYLIGLFGWGLSNLVMLPPIMLFAIVFPLFFLRYARASWLVFDQYFQPRTPPGVQTEVSETSNPVNERQT